jgi:hypothetical protein
MKPLGLSRPAATGRLVYNGVPEQVGIPAHQRSTRKVSYGGLLKRPQEQQQAPATVRPPTPGDGEDYARYIAETQAARGLRQDRITAADQRNKSDELGIRKLTAQAALNEARARTGIAAQDYGLNSEKFNYEQQKDAADRADKLVQRDIEREAAAEKALADRVAKSKAGQLSTKDIMSADKSARASLAAFRNSK